LRDAFYRYSDVLVERGDHIRLQYINLNYQAKLNFLKRVGLKDLNVYLNTSNLGLLWTANKEGIDPDYSRGLASIPPATTITLGLRAGF